MIRKNDRMKKISDKVLKSKPIPAQGSQQVAQPTGQSVNQMMQGLPQGNMRY